MTVFAPSFSSSPETRRIIFGYLFRSRPYQRIIILTGLPHGNTPPRAEDARKTSGRVRRPCFEGTGQALKDRSKAEELLDTEGAGTSPEAVIAVRTGRASPNAALARLPSPQSLSLLFAERLSKLKAEQVKGLGHSSIIEKIKNKSSHRNERCYF